MTKNSNRFAPGNPGKPKGAVNHTTRELKDMIVGALEGAGGQQYLQEQATKNPAAFMALLGKILPKDANVAITGAEGGPLEIKVTFQKPKSETTHDKT